MGANGPRRGHIGPIYIKIGNVPLIAQNDEKTGLILDLFHIVLTCTL